MTEEKVSFEQKICSQRKGLVEAVKEEMSKVHLQIKEFASEGKSIMKKKEEKGSILKEALLRL